MEREPAATPKKKYTYERSKGDKTLGGMSQFTFGVELEFNGDKDKVESALTAAGLKAKGWRVVHDGSIGVGLGGEIVSPILSLDRWGEVEDACHAATSVPSTYVSRSCGFHVHVGAQGWSTPQIVNLIKSWYKYEELLVLGCATLMERRKQYCKTLASNVEFKEAILAGKVADLETLKYHWYYKYRHASGHGSRQSDKLHQSRYVSLNIHSLFYHGTLEFRMFNGSLNPAKVRGYLDLVLALCARAKAAKWANAKTRSTRVKNPRYALRMLLIQIGLIGDEFKTSRKVLLMRIEGDLAYKKGRKPKPTAEPSS